MKLPIWMFAVSLYFIQCSSLVKEGENSTSKQEETSKIEVKAPVKRTIDIESTDGIQVKADIYDIGKKDAPVILLFHQAGYSRGEYLEIAPKLNELGYNCIAIDQRSGKEVNGVTNETASQASAKGLPAKYPDAFVDLEATLKYAQSEYPNSKIIAWGSSYSSSLVFILAQKYPDAISATLSFSPGEYFKFEGKSIGEYASDVKCPTFITSAKNEHDSWKGIYGEISAEGKQSFLPNTSGQHGSKALWESKEGHDAYWDAVKAFLKKV